MNMKFQDFLKFKKDVKSLNESQREPTRDDLKIAAEFFKLYTPQQLLKAQQTPIEQTTQVNEAARDEGGIFATIMGYFKLQTLLPQYAAAMKDSVKNVVSPDKDGKDDPKAGKGTTTGDTETTGNTPVEKAESGLQNATDAENEAKEAVTDAQEELDELKKDPDATDKELDKAYDKVATAKAEVKTATAAVTAAKEKLKTAQEEEAADDSEEDVTDDSEEGAGADGEKDPVKKAEAAKTAADGELKTAQEDLTKLKDKKDPPATEEQLTKAGEKVTKAETAVKDAGIAAEKAKKDAPKISPEDVKKVEAAIDKKKEEITKIPDETLAGDIKKTSAKADVDKIEAKLLAAQNKPEAAEKQEKIAQKREKSVEAKKKELAAKGNKKTKKATAQNAAEDTSMYSTHIEEDSNRTALKAKEDKADIIKDEIDTIVDDTGSSWLESVARAGKLNADLAKQNAIIAISDGPEKTAAQEAVDKIKGKIAKNEIVEPSKEESDGIKAEVENTRKGITKLEEDKSAEEKEQEKLPKEALTTAMRITSLEQKIAFTEDILGKKEEVNAIVNANKLPKDLAYVTDSQTAAVEKYKEELEELKEKAAKEAENPSEEVIAAAKEKLAAAKADIKKLETELTDINAELKKGGGSNESTVYEEEDAEAEKIAKMAPLLARKKELLSAIVTKKEDANKLITATPLKGEEQLSVKDDQAALDKASAEVESKTVELTDKAEDAGVDIAAVQAATTKNDNAEFAAKDASDKVKALPIIADKVEDEEKKEEILDQVPDAKKDAEQKKKLADDAKAELDKVLGKKPKPKKENESKILRFADFMESKKRNG